MTCWKSLAIYLYHGRANTQSPYEDPSPWHQSPYQPSRALRDKTGIRNKECDSDKINSQNISNCPRISPSNTATEQYRQHHPCPINHNKACGSPHTMTEANLPGFEISITYKIPTPAGLNAHRLRGDPLIRVRARGMLPDIVYLTEGTCTYQPLDR